MSVEYPEFLIRSKQQKRFIHSKQDRKSVAVQIQTYSSNLKKSQIGGSSLVYLFNCFIIRIMSMSL